MNESIQAGGSDQVCKICRIWFVICRNTTSEMYVTASSFWPYIATPARPRWTSTATTPWKTSSIRSATISVASETPYRCSFRLATWRRPERRTRTLPPNENSRLIICNLGGNSSVSIGSVMLDSRPEHVYYICVWWVQNSLCAFRIAMFRKYMVWLFVLPLKILYIHCIQHVQCINCLRNRNEILSREYVIVNYQKSEGKV